jgi:hypothetical protein
VRDAQAVEVTQREHDLAGVDAREVERKAALALQVVEHVAAARVVHHLRRGG